MSNNVSFIWVKRVTEIGLTMMRQKTVKERMDSIMQENNINVPELTNLITECAAAAEAYVKKHGDRVNASDAELINSLLGKIDAEATVKSADPDELAEWVMDLVKSVEEIA